MLGLWNAITVLVFILKRPSKLISPPLPASRVVSDPGLRDRIFQLFCIFLYKGSRERMWFVTLKTADDLRPCILKFRIWQNPTNSLPQIWGSLLQRCGGQFFFSRKSSSSILITKGHPGWQQGRERRTRLLGVSGVESRPGIWAKFRNEQHSGRHTTWKPFCKRFRGESPLPAPSYRQLCTSESTSSCLEFVP